MGRLRKGLLFTLSILLISSTLLYLLTSFSTYSNSLKTSSEILSDLENLNQVYDYTEHAVKSIISNQLVKISKQSTNISFEQNLSLYSNYLIQLQELELFFEPHTRFNISINRTALQNLKINLTPQNIQITNNPGEITFIPEDTEESEGNIQGYSVIIKLNESTPHFNWTAIAEVPPSNPNAIYFHIGIQGTNGTATTSKYLNRNANSELILSDSLNQSVILLRMQKPSELIIIHNSDLYVKTTLILQNITHAKTSESIINITSVSGLGKQSVVYIDES